LSACIEDSLGYQSMDGHRLSIPCRIMVVGGSEVDNMQKMTNTFGPIGGGMKDYNL